MNKKNLKFIDLFAGIGGIRKGFEDKNTEEYKNKVLNLTGPRNLSMSEIAEIVSEKTGREITYYNETVEEAYQSRQKWEAEQWEYDSWVSTYTAIEKGEQEGVSLDIEKVLDRPATSLEQLLEEYVGRK